MSAVVCKHWLSFFLFCSHTIMFLQVYLFSSAKDSSEPHSKSVELARVCMPALSYGWANSLFAEKLQFALKSGQRIIPMDSLAHDVCVMESLGNMMGWHLYLDQLTITMRNHVVICRRIRSTFGCQTWCEYRFYVNRRWTPIQFHRLISQWWRQQKWVSND